MNTSLLETSKVVSLLRIMRKDYCFITDWLKKTYKDSQTYRLNKVFWEGTKINFRYSFLGRITEIRGEDNLKEILENSRFVEWLVKIYNDWKKRVTDYLNTSLIAKHATGLKNELYVLPVKTGSIIVVTAILSDLFFYSLFKNSMWKGIGLSGWIIRGMLLFAGLAGLFCEVSLKNLESSSLFLKWINSYKQSDLEEK